MMELNLHICHALSREYFTPPIAPSDLPEGVVGAFSVYDGAPHLPENAATLVVTDDERCARTLARGKSERLHLVLIGRADDALADALDDVWDGAEGGGALRRRYLRLLRRLKDEFDLHFYKNALLATIDTVPDLVWFKRADGAHALVNNAFAEAAGKAKGEIQGQDHFAVWGVPRPVSGNAAYACAESDAAAIASGERHVCDETLKTRAGFRQLVTCKAPLYDMFGNLFGTVGVGHDVTGVDGLGIQLTMLLENLPFPICVFTPEWKAARMNSTFAYLAGIGSDEELAAFDYLSWKEESFSPVGPRAAHTASREYRFRLEGEIRRFVLTELELRNYFGDLVGRFCTLEDVTYRRAYEQSILDAANTDMLTGLYNRRYFDSFVRGNTGRPFHLLYMDLDHFKEINDLHGHKAGDAVLAKVAELIELFFPNAVAARLGGDEFVVVEENHDRAFIDQRCAAFESAVAQALRPYGQDSSVSIGIARTDGSAEDIERVLQESDRAMYNVKKRHHEKK